LMTAAAQPQCCQHRHREPQKQSMLSHICLPVREDLVAD
jgi:hypothetical protein